MNGIPSKINMFNVYRDGTRLIGVSGEVALPDFEAVTETLSGPGILGEIDDPTIGHFGSQEMEIPFRVLDEDLLSMLDPTKPLNLTLRGSVQVAANNGVEYRGLRVVVRGRPKALTGGTVKQGAPTESSLKLELTYILIELGGRQMVELDKLNSVFRINGTDVLAKARSLC